MMQDVDAYSRYSQNPKGDSIWIVGLMEGGKMSILEEITLELMSKEDYSRCRST